MCHTAQTGFVMPFKTDFITSCFLGNRLICTMIVLYNVINHWLPQTITWHMVARPLGTLSDNHFTRVLVLQLHAMSTRGQDVVRQKSHEHWKDDYQIFCKAVSLKSDTNIQHARISNNSVCGYKKEISLLKAM